MQRYRALRDFTTRLCRNLQPEDFVVQSMPDVSPTKWHLAHTTWFFETFVVKVWRLATNPRCPNTPFSLTPTTMPPERCIAAICAVSSPGPTVQETLRYRESIDECVIKLIENADDALVAEIEPIVILGIHHEQQHQELLVTDIKHVFAQNPLHPVFEKT